MNQRKTKEEIIESAITLFNTYGCKGVTMDRIATTLHMSKRTLYETFDSKEVLICESMAHIYREIGVENIERFKMIEEPLLATIFIIRNITAKNNKYYRVISDASLYYSDLINKLVKDICDRLKNRLYTTLSVAKDKGDLRDGINIENTINMLIYFVVKGSTRALIPEDEFPELLDEICFTYMRGLLSTSAIKRYDENEKRFKEVLKAKP